MKLFKKDDDLCCKGKSGYIFVYNILFSVHRKRKEDYSVWPAEVTQYGSDDEAVRTVKILPQKKMEIL